MHNQRGITLIEILASITILMILIGVGFMLFASVSSLWHNSVQTRNDNSSVNFAINVITREAADPVKIYLASANELRFKTVGVNSVAGTYKSLMYDALSHTLTLYELVDPADLVNVTSPLDANKYTKGITLSNIVKPDTTNGIAAFAVKQSNGDLMPVPTTFMNGELFTISINFEYTRLSVYNVKTTKYKNISTNIKLFKE
jgi:type II secretory pathway pseudopilin PulG